MRPFKGIFCDDISEFESSHASQAVESRQQRSPDTVIVISSDGKGDRAVESLEVRPPLEVYAREPRGHYVQEGPGCQSDRYANFAFVEPEREYAPAPFGRHSACTSC